MNASAYAETGYVTTVINGTDEHVLDPEEARAFAEALISAADAADEQRADWDLRPRGPTTGNR